MTINIIKYTIHTGLLIQSTIVLYVLYLIQYMVNTPEIDTTSIKVVYITYPENLYFNGS